MILAAGQLPPNKACKGNSIYLFDNKGLGSELIKQLF